MLNFCTLFDSNYLSRGIAMYESLIKHCEEFTLFIFPFDKNCENALKKLQLKNVTVVSLSEFENESLLRVKANRTRGEYCWTCTSSSILYVLDKYKLDHCTYLDADLYFYSSPRVIFDEMGSDSVLITDHRFTPKYQKHITNGKYCVQYMTFKNNTDGLTALKWWVNACIDWCYNKHEDGKFGDQKYLDDWTTRFQGIHELQHLGGGVAPWNVQQYDISKENGYLFGTNKNNGEKFKLIFYHFHGLKFLEQGKVDLCEYDLRPVEKELIYKTYLLHIEDIKNRLNKLDERIISNENVFQNNTLRSNLRKLKRILENRYNVFDRQTFMNTALWHK